MPSRNTARLSSIVIDNGMTAGEAYAVAQERAMAISDLLERNDFTLSNGKLGPYRLHIGAQDQRLVLEFRGEDGVHLHTFGLSLTPLRRVIKDYRQICSSHTHAVRGGQTYAIEAIDMARRGLHNEGAGILTERLAGKAVLDSQTARQLFSLIANLSLRATPAVIAVTPLVPKLVLFICTMNAIRSPMAAAITHHYFGERIYAASAGVSAGDPDPFVGVVMDEIGIDLKAHRPHGLSEKEDLSFDLLVTLSPEAQAKTSSKALEPGAALEHWSASDPSGVQGSRETILDAYRAVRDDLVIKVKERFEKLSD